MDAYKLLVNGTDITGRVGGLTSTDALDALSVQLGFQVAVNPRDKLLPPMTVQPGDRVQLFNGSTLVFRGLVIKAGLDGQVQCNDFGFYLNKSKIILQLFDAPADDAIRQLGAKAGVSVGSVPSIGLRLTEPYINEEPSAILSDILDKATAATGKRYFSRVEPESGLNVYEYPVSPDRLSVQLARNLRPFDPTWSLGAITGEDSMEALRNQVVIYREEDKTAQILATAADGGSISKYGWLQHMETADAGATRGDAQAKAQTLLRDLNRVQQTRRVDNMLGADVRAGTMLRFSSDAFGFAGNYIIRQADHTYFPQHTMKLEVFAP